MEKKGRHQGEEESSMTRGGLWHEGGGKEEGLSDFEGRGVQES